MTLSALPARCGERALPDGSWEAARSFRTCSRAMNLRPPGRTAGFQPAAARAVDDARGFVRAWPIPPAAGPATAGSALRRRGSWEANWRVGRVTVKPKFDCDPSPPPSIPVFRVQPFCAYVRKGCRSYPQTGVVLKGRRQRRADFPPKFAGGTVLASTVCSSNYQCMNRRPNQPAPSRPAVATTSAAIRWPAFVTSNRQTPPTVFLP